MRKNWYISGYVLTTALLLWLADAAQADDTSTLSKAKDAYFHLIVEGTPNWSAPNGDMVKRIGKAFAVGPTLLVTSAYNVGDSTVWQKKQSDPEDPVQRVLSQLDRRVKIVGSTEGAIHQIDNPVVLSPPPDTVDAAEIELSSSHVASYFPISICDLDTKTNYKLLTTNGDPSDAQSVTHPRLVNLIPIGFEPEHYGGLYKFELDPGEQTTLANDGNTGSPILTNDGNVVAVVSAIGAKDANNKTTIFGTPIRSLVSRSILMAQSLDSDDAIDNVARCSLSETVGRIEREVDSQASWKVDLQRGEDGKPTGAVKLSYQGMSDKPIVDHIKVQFQYVGESIVQPANQRNRNNVRVITQGLPPDSTVSLTKNGTDSKEFIDTKIIDEGRNLLEKALNVPPNENGYIDYVDLFIYAYTKSNRLLSRQEAQFRWVESTE